MKKIVFLFLTFLIAINTIFAQLPGDTIVVNSFNYAQTYKPGVRDTMVNFPNIPGITFEKIIMLYNMRCKNGVVGNSVTPQAPNGCGEWDYSCNTYITDSTTLDSVKAKSPSHIITGFSGNIYPYTTIPTFTFYKYHQQQVFYTNTISETSAMVGAGAVTSNTALHTQLQNSKSQFLYSASELLAGGLVAGNITSIKLFVNNVGSNAQFLKIKIKHTSQVLLNADTPELFGFTEVYFLNTTLVNGSNQFNFYNPFVWNGTDNILVEYSFSNTTIGTDNIIMSDTSAINNGLISMANDFHITFDGTNKINMGSTNFTNINNQISICFWANGNDKILPINSSILESTNALNQRQINIHLPWSNSNIYWDCGNGSGYDRINQTATATTFSGSWNHWAFTKNATTGIMNIYLNGTLWLSGTSKIIPIAITNMILGTGANNNNAYFGKIDDFTMWNTELSQATIQAWMKKNIDNTHPNFANLQTNLLLNDGIGNTCVDASMNPSNGTIVGTPIWNITKGKDIFKNFVATNNRPKTEFVQGVYTQSTNTIVVIDSIINNANTVKEFSVVNNNYNLLSTNNYYFANQSFIYNGDDMQLIDSVAIPIVGTINITALNHMQRSPSRYQIMSFVTPYGNGLDLGVNGKTYSFDVSDYAPILKGKKRMTMDAGGQWQEDMDIKFLCIVGTPPQNVKSISNVWKVDYIDYANILNDNFFEPRTVLLDATGKSFKMKTAISGHGQEGEFIPRYHLLNINNGVDEFNWEVKKACAENPVYPQGGTWLYDRAGWCPGMATDTKENDITPFVTPGANAIIDYNITTASGDSRYWVSNQLVTYGDANFNLDASIVDIKNPSNKVEHARTNAICSKPIVTIKNTGKQAINNLVIEYCVNGYSPKESFTWTGNLAFMETVDITLPHNNIWAGVNGPSGNVFYAIIKSVNTISDDYLLNNKMQSPFDITGVVPSKFIVHFRTNNLGAESKYEIKDGNGTQIFVRDNMNNNTLYKDTFSLAGGCYQMIINDSGEDGLNWWANTSAGAGYCSIKKSNSNNLKTFNPDFGKSIIYNFTIDFPLHFEDIDAENLVELYPNPAHDQFTLQGKNLKNAKIGIYNQIGQLMKLDSRVELDKIIFNTTSIPTGFYSIAINSDNGNMQHLKIIVD